MISFFAGNMISETSRGLHFRLLLIPWMKKNSAIFCLRGKDYCSSFPVKYVPKKSANAQELQSTSTTPVRGSEKIEMPSCLEPKVPKIKVSNGGKNSQRSFVLDQKSHNRTQNQNQRTSGGLTFHESEEDILYHSGVADYGLMKEPPEVAYESCVNEGKDSENQDELRDSKAKQEVEKLAIELLAKRAYSAVELKKKLLRKRFTIDSVDDVIMEFQNRGLINDSLYAEMLCRSRWSSSSWGPRRIKQALFMKGVSGVDAEKAIKLVFNEDEAGGDQESREDSILGMSKLSMDHLYAQASKQWRRSTDASTDARKSRVIRWLQYRGFNWGVISFTLKKLESKFPP